MNEFLRKFDTIRFVAPWSIFRNFFGNFSFFLNSNLNFEFGPVWYRPKLEPGRTFPPVWPVTGQTGPVPTGLVNPASHYWTTMLALRRLWWITPDRRTVQIGKFYEACWDVPFYFGKALGGTKRYRRYLFYFDMGPTYFGTHRYLFLGTSWYLLCLSHPFQPDGGSLFVSTIVKFLKFYRSASNRLLKELLSGPHLEIIYMYFFWLFLTKYLFNYVNGKVTIDLIRLLYS